MIPCAQTYRGEVMFKLLIAFILTINAFAVTTTCYDGIGSEIKFEGNYKLPQGSYLDSLIVLKGPVLDNLFNDKEHLQERYRFGDGSIFSFEVKNGAFEIMTRNFSQGNQIDYVRCGRYEVCVAVRSYNSGVLVTRYIGNNDLTFVGEHIFQRCN